MKRLVLAGFGAVAVFMTGGVANAADLPRREPMPVKAATYAAPYNWTGFYLGINGGAGWGRSDISAPFASGGFNNSGGVLGGTVGYNWQNGATVYGLEGDLDYNSTRNSAACGIATCTVKNTWLGTARGRLGYAFGSVMPYVTGGLAVGNIKDTILAVGEATQTKAGYAAGAGVEAAIFGPLTAKVEYLYADLGRGASVAGADTRFKESLVRGGFNYRF
jgi:outer membrane immunogenic protein